MESGGVAATSYRIQAIKYVARNLKVSAKEAMEWLKKWHLDDHVRM